MLKSKVKVKKKPKNVDSKINKLKKAMPKNPIVKVGLPKGSNNYPDGTSVIMVGSVHEFGSPENGVPERSFLRSTVFENDKKYLGLTRKLGAKILKGEISAELGLGKLGLIVQTDVRQKIVDIKEPPLVHREGNPLVDTGHLLETITYEVE